ncbi:MAG: aconitate hydratase [Proteobacteria bacterium]|nr:aconitate hydratase [Pseudomonadota bacterium]
MTIESTPQFVENVYKKMTERLAVVRNRLNRPLTLAEKIIYGHLNDPKTADLTPGTSYLELRPDRVAFQDATAQMAILQFMLANKDYPAVPVTVHCDHLIRAHTGANDDLKVANTENKEVYDFLASSSQKYGFGFWKPGSGIIHQVVLEQYAFPGLMMLGTDSHTPNAGGLGAFASGVGGADAVDVMVDLPWEVLHPHIVGVKLTGEMKGWTAPKDVILKLLDILTVEGGTNRVIEYFGPGCASISCTGKATICNMGAELGATTSLFPHDERMDTYLKSTGRAELVKLAGKYADLLVADKGSEKHYQTVIEIDLSTLEPHVVGPHSPDLAAPVSKMGAHLKKGGWPTNLTSALIGSCTNSSYEDMGRIAEMADQAIAAGAKIKIPLLVTPGSEQVRATIARDGIMQKLEKLGAVVLANACGPCIGQWKRDDIKAGESNSIISSYNRNFPKRNDGNAATCSFIGSPETVLAYAFHGRIDIDPFTTPIDLGNGKTFTLKAPGKVAEVPAKGYVPDEEGFLPPSANGGKVNVSVASSSDRLQLLTPFDAWSGKDYTGLPVLMKAKGKCTTDHISPAGPWLKYRGHLQNISNNMFSGAVNAFTGEPGRGKDLLSGDVKPYNEVAIHYKGEGLGWVAVGDSNYGEGSSREHAAMSPRFLGARAVITRSFARIHETNLKKQGILPLTFTNPADYDLIEEEDHIDIKGLTQLTPGKPVTAVVHHKDGSEVEIKLKHTLNAEQIQWFKDGSALNTLRKHK